jgi:membrane-bound lytic murein transglycosylase A
VDVTDVAAQQAFFEQRFRPWRITTNAGDDTGLITGYYEALLTGSLTPAPGRVPLYGVPDDLLTLDLVSLYPDLKGQRLRGRVDGRTVKPYWSRAEIAEGKAGLESKVLAWADNAVDAFFLEVQGSGRLQLEDGRLLRLGYADQNGHPYKSIGKWLVDQGELTLSQASMQSIRAWAEKNPQRLQEMLNANPSFVFFRVMEHASGGAIGALNLPLTDGASIAVDPKFIPLGSPVYLATTRPDNQQPLTRLMHAQDTGGAIRGPVRADFFWGFGHDAGALAGRMKQKGQMWLLWPNGMALPAGK